ncbi:MAG TPA: HlyD family type I secretion periplasmic adaptor subunit [Devosia sp.]|nr:HlyD family type I secretion periplasmic adaptor subunit [Devosia sp.]
MANPLPAPQRLPAAPNVSTALGTIERLREEFRAEIATGDAPAAPLIGDADRSLRRHAWLAIVLIALLVFGLGGWSAMTNVSGAIVANGALVVESGSQKVQHPEGGVVREIFARDEDHVTAGQILFRLDGTLATANLAVTESQLRAAYAQMARLDAESTGSTALVIPPAAGDLASGAEFEQLLAAQKLLLESRAKGRALQVEQLEEQIRQLDGQVSGLTAQRDAVQQSLDLASAEETDLAKLAAGKLVSTSRLNEASKQRASLEGEKGRLTAALDEASSTIAERRVQIGRVGADFLSAVMTDLGTLRESIAELQQRRISSLDRLARLDVRAPQDGVIHESIVRTVGGVLQPGETAMLVVPEADRVLVDARLTQYDVDKIFAGQAVILRFPSLDQRVTPELKGEVVSVSPDVIRDPVTGQPFYAMRVTALPGEREKLPAGTRLVPGMPVEAFAQLGDRSVLSYLLHPVTEQLSRMFIEK